MTFLSFKEKLVKFEVVTSGCCLVFSLKQPTGPNQSIQVYSLPKFFNWKEYTYLF